MAAKQLLVAAATLKKSLNPYNWFASQPIHHPEFPPLTAQQLLVESNGASCFYGRGEVMSPYRQSLSIEVELRKGLRALKIVCPRNGTRKAFSSHFSWSDGSNSVKEYNRNYPYTSIKTTFLFKEAPLIDTGTDPLGDIDALTYYKELKRLNATASKLALKNLTDGQKELMRKHLDELGQHGKDTANEVREVCSAVREGLVEEFGLFDNLCEKVRVNSNKAIEVAKNAGRRFEEKDGRTMITRDLRGKRKFRP